MGRRAFALGFLVASCAASTLVAEEIEVVVREGTNFAAALSPSDGSFILDLQGTLWRLPGEGGEATALTDGMGDDRQPHISPDGTRVVFQSYRAGMWDIWVANTDGSELTALTDSEFDDREPMFSPDGTKVAFSSDRNGNYDIWVLDLETAQLRALTSDEDEDYMPAWSPGGDAVAFVSERGAESALYRLDFDAADAAAGPTRLAAFSGRIAAPSWSPDGSRIALRVLELGSQSADALGAAAESSRLVLVAAERGEVVDALTAEDVFPFRTVWANDTEIIYTAAGKLWRQSLEGGAPPAAIEFSAAFSLDRPSYPRREVDLLADGDALPVRGMVRPVISPDGSKIAYAALGDIWTVSSEGGEPTALTRDEHLDSDPHWSPDSSDIVFSSDRLGTMDLWVKSATAAHRVFPRQLTHATGAEMAPAWSPDGTRIAYVDERSRIHVVLANGADDETLSPQRRGVSQPSWSSDSAHLAFTVHEPVSSRFREGVNRIHVLDTRTRMSVELDVPAGSVGTRDGDGPVWSPDGRSLAFAMDGGLWVLPVDVDGTPRDAPREIVREAVDFPSWSPKGESIIYVAPKGLKRVGLERSRARYIDIQHHYEAVAAGGRFMIRDVRVVDGSRPSPLEHHDVVIDGNRIESIEPTVEIPPEDMRVIDGAGRTLIPGLIETHTHLSLPAWGSQHGKVWLAYGITSIRTLADAPYRALEERESVRAGRRIGPRVFMTGAAMDGERVYYTGYAAIGDEEELAREMQRAFDLGYDLIKTYVRLPDGLQMLAIEEAHRQGIFVTSHELYPALAYGIDGIEHVAGTSRRGYSPKLSELRRSYDDVVELIARSGVYFTPTVLVYGGWSLALAREPELLSEQRFATLFPRWARERFEGAPVDDDVDAAVNVVTPIFETIESISERGGRILAGTDAPIAPYGLSLLLEIEQLSEAGLGPLAALDSATRVAAEALGVDDELGTIEVGKIADLVLLGGNPLEDIKNLRKTEMVIVNGRLLTVDQLLRSP